MGKSATFTGKIKWFLEHLVRDLRFVFFESDKYPSPNALRLMVRGKISEVIISSKPERNAVSVKAHAEMVLENTGEEIANLINPIYYEQSKEKSFSRQEKSFSRFPRLYSAFYSESPFASEAITKFIEKLGAGGLPKQFRITLRPKEKIEWDEIIYFEFDSLEKRKHIWQGVGWYEFINSGNSMRLKFEYRLPNKIYAMCKSKPELYKVLYNNDKEPEIFPLAEYCNEHGNCKKLITLTTKPIYIDFSKAKVCVDENPAEVLINIR